MRSTQPWVKPLPVLQRIPSTEADKESSIDLVTFLLGTLMAAPILVGDNDKVVGAVGIDNDVLEFASRHVVLEQDIKFGIGTTL